MIGNVRYSQIVSISCKSNFENKHVRVCFEVDVIVYRSIMNYVLLSNLENLKYSVILKHPIKYILMKNAYLFDRGGNDSKSQIKVGSAQT